MHLRDFRDARIGPAQNDVERTVGEAHGDAAAKCESEGGKLGRSWIEVKIRCWRPAVAPGPSPRWCHNAIISLIVFEPGIRRP